MWNEGCVGQGSFSSCLTASVEEEILHVKLQDFLIINFNVCFCLKAHTGFYFILLVGSGKEVLLALLK